MNNRDNRDTEIHTREHVKDRDHDARHTKEYGRERDRDKMDTSWILPALIGLLLLGTLGYFLFRRPGGLTERAATTTETVTTRAREAVEEAKPAEIKTVTPEEKPKA